MKVALTRGLWRKWWVLPAIILLIGLVVAGGIVFASKRQVAVRESCGGSREADFSCYKKMLAGQVTSDGPEKAFVTLKAAYERSDYVRSQCHQLTHVIGQTAVKRYPDVGSAYLHGDNFCWSGYYHGVMQGLAAKIGIENLKQQANTICSSVAQNQKQYGFDHFNCVHGLGHGFMGVQSNELFTALGSCDVLEDQWERESCYGGVFMENVMAFQSAETKTKYLKSDDALYPCTAVATKYKEQCYLMQTSHALVVEHNDFKEVFDVCATVPEEAYQLICYQSLGRDASGQSNSNAVQTKSTCLLGPTQAAKENCVIGAVKDFISYFHSDQQGLDFCRSFEDSSIKATCLKTGSEYYKLL